MADGETRSAAERLIAWARTGPSNPCADPLDRPVSLEIASCPRELQVLLGRVHAGRRVLTRPLDLPPRLLPPP